MTLLYQSLFIVASFFIVIVWQYFDLSSYTGIAVGALTILYLTTSLRRRKNKTIVLNVFAMNTLVLILIGSTGGFSSPLYYLLYILLFFLAFFLVPETVFVFTFLVCLLFLSTVLSIKSLESSAKLGSLVTITPVAYFFGKAMRQKIKEDGKIAQLEEKTEKATNKILQDVNQVAKEANLSQQDMTKLADIVKETEQLKQGVKK
ncbi:MAG: hypothetical protein HY431_02190 [Candidatus Levybacteria bacterium]|nr:hypothetical protein [Candidatus Levybacteria bacterium]